MYVPVGELTKLPARLFAAPLRDFVGLLDARVDQLGGADAAASEPEPEAEAADEAPAETADEAPAAEASAETSEETADEAAEETKEEE